MRLVVQVKPNSKNELVEKQGDGSYLVRVNVPPTEGRANDRVVELLSKELKVPKSKIALISGHKSKRKIFEII